MQRSSNFFFAGQKAAKTSLDRPPPDFFSSVKLVSSLGLFLHEILLFCLFFLILSYYRFDLQLDRV